MFNGRAMPILVAENGTPEIVDHNRSCYVTSHLEQLQRARNDGVNVIGYRHWSIADNWEWIDGYRQEARFGLFSVDHSVRDSPDKLHSITDGAFSPRIHDDDPETLLPAAISSFGKYQPDGFGLQHPTMSPFRTFDGSIDGQPLTSLLSLPAGTAALTPQRVTGFVGMLFYRDVRRWVRLRHIIWEPASRTLQFYHTAFSAPPQVPERIFAVTVDRTGQVMNGLATKIVGNMLVTHNCVLSRLALAGMWQGAATITLSLGCPEGTWRGRALACICQNGLHLPI